MTLPSNSKPRLMVVDDESDNLDLLYRTFRREFQVFTADSAFKALEILNQESEMAIIISDQRMPKMSGTELLSITAERYPDTIRILLTAYTDVEDLVGAINAGKVFKYITKPWKPDELKQVVYQSADTYRVLKQRTNELHRALRRESLFNLVTTAIRGSLDYHSMLQTMVNALGQSFDAAWCGLRAVDLDARLDQRIRLSDGVVTYVSPHSSDTDSSERPDWAVVEAQLAAIATTEPGTPQQLAEPAGALVLPLIYQQALQAVVVLQRPDTIPSWSTEDITLLEQVGEQAALALSQARLYQQIQHQTEQMRAELAVARQIQTNLLRQHWTNPDPLKIQAVCRPAREIGGDFFEVYVHPPQGDVWLAVGDVSGKGIPAALFMASVLSMLRRELSQEHLPPPTDILKSLNSTLFADLVSSNCFVTMVLACYTVERQELTYANAGHIYPLVWAKHALNADQPESSSGEFPFLALKERNVPLGILPDWNAPLGRLMLRSGDILVLSSDGVTEATVESAAQYNPTSSNGMLQQLGLWNLLKQQGDSIDLADVLNQIQSYNPVQADDQTLLSLEVL